MTERELTARDQQQSRGNQSDGESVQPEDFYTFENVAVEYGIPPERWDVPAVRLFIEVSQRVRVLQEMFRGQDDWGTEPAWASSIGPEGTPSLEQRFLAVAELADVMDIVLKDGLRYHNPSVMRSEGDRKFLAEKAGFALELYGLKVVDAKEGQGRNANTDGDIIDVPRALGRDPKQLSDIPKDC